MKNQFKSIGLNAQELKNFKGGKRAKGGELLPPALPTELPTSANSIAVPPAMPTRPF